MFHRQARLLYVLYGMPRMAALQPWLLAGEQEGKPCGTCWLACQTRSGMSAADVAQRCTHRYDTLAALSLLLLMVYISYSYRVLDVVVTM